MQDARARASPSGKHSMLRAISHRRRVVGKRQVVCVERERRSLLPVDEDCRNPILLALQVLSLSLFCALSSVLPARRVGSPSHVTDDRDADLVTQAPRWTPQLEKPSRGQGQDPCCIGQTARLSFPWSWSTMCKG
jgi:hypothetical protein